MGGDIPRRTPDFLVFGDLSKDVFCVFDCERPHKCSWWWTDTGDKGHEHGP